MSQEILNSHKLNAAAFLLEYTTLKVLVTKKDRRTKNMQMKTQLTIN